MKKTLTALAVLGAFAGSALATDIALYGVVDLGLQYQNTKSENTLSNNVDYFMGCEKGHLGS